MVIDHHVVKREVGWVEGSGSEVGWVEGSGSEDEDATAISTELLELTSIPPIIIWEESKLNNVAGMDDDIFEEFAPALPDLLEAEVAPAPPNVLEAEVALESLDVLEAPPDVFEALVAPPLSEALVAPELMDILDAQIAPLPPDLMEAAALLTSETLIAPVFTTPPVITSRVTVDGETEKRRDAREEQQLPRASELNAQTQETTKAGKLLIVSISFCIVFFFCVIAAMLYCTAPTTMGKNVRIIRFIPRRNIPRNIPLFRDIRFTPRAGLT